VPAYPGAQIVQAETDVLPVAEPVVDTPVGQVEQEAAPEDEYFPEEHVKQVNEEVASEEDEKLPAGHNVQEDEPAAA
jgi:hypothetical protein